MKIQAKSTLEPLYGKVPDRLRRWLPVVEGYQTRLTAEYRILEPCGGEPALSMKPLVVQPYGWAFQKTAFQTTEWQGADTVTTRFYPRGSGYSEVRIFFRGLEKDDEIVDETGQIQSMRGHPYNGEKLPYSCRVYRTYSLYELVTIVLAGSVLVFTVLLSVLTFVLAVLTCRLAV